MRKLTKRPRHLISSPFTHLSLSSRSRSSPVAQMDHTQPHPLPLALPLHLTQYPVHLPSHPRTTLQSMIPLPRVTQTVLLRQHIVVRQQPQFGHVPHDFPPQTERLVDEGVLGGMVVTEGRAPSNVSTGKPTEGKIGAEGFARLGGELEREGVLGLAGVEGGEEDVDGFLDGGDVEGQVGLGWGGVEWSGVE